MDTFKDCKELRKQCTKTLRIRRHMEDHPPPGGANHLLRHLMRQTIGVLRPKVYPGHLQIWAMGRLYRPQIWMGVVGEIRTFRLPLLVKLECSLKRHPALYVGDLEEDLVGVDMFILDLLTEDSCHLKLLIAVEVVEEVGEVILAEGVVTAGEVIS